MLRHSSYAPKMRQRHCLGRETFLLAKPKKKARDASAFVGGDKTYLPTSSLVMGNGESIPLSVLFTSMWYMTRETVSVYHRRVLVV